MPLDDSPMGNLVTSVRKSLKPILAPALQSFAGHLHARLLEVSARYAGHFITPAGAFDIACFLRHEKIEGDYLEFGVFSGHSFVQAKRVIMEQVETYNVEASQDAPTLKVPLKRRFFAFDSFQGLPGGDERFKKGSYSNSKEGFVRVLKSQRVFDENVVLVEGWFNETCIPETAKNHGIQKVAWAYIDCDLYESTVPVLDFLGPLLQTGSVLSFNDWWCYKGSSQRGQQKAVGEWLSRNPHIRLKEFIKYGYTDMVFVVEIESVAF